VLIDLGVAVFSGIDLVLARLGMRLWWLRFVPWSGIAATIWLNVADESTSVGVVAHAAPPVLWVVGVELAAHVIRWGAGLVGDSARWRSAGRMDRVRLSRWLLAPWSTLVIRRWMILLEERSYERANARWWERKQAKWALQDTYGPLMWHVRAPRRERGLYRWGHLSPAAITPSPAPAEGDGDGDDKKRRPARGRTRAGFADFVRAAEAIDAVGGPVNRTLVTRRLREDGFSLGNDLADHYLARYLDARGAAAA
jgi:hypothetical protein